VVVPSKIGFSPSSSCQQFDGLRRDSKLHGGPDDGRQVAPSPGCFRGVVGRGAAGISVRVCEEAPGCGTCCGWRRGESRSEHSSWGAPLTRRGRTAASNPAQHGGAAGVSASRASPPRTARESAVGRCAVLLPPPAGAADGAGGRRQARPWSSSRRRAWRRRTRATLPHGARTDARRCSQRPSRTWSTSCRDWRRTGWCSRPSWSRSTRTSPTASSACRNTGARPRTLHACAGRLRTRNRAHSAGPARLPRLSFHLQPRRSRPRTRAPALAHSCL